MRVGHVGGTDDSAIAHRQEDDAQASGQQQKEQRAPLIRFLSDVGEGEGEGAGEGDVRSGHGSREVCKKKGQHQAEQVEKCAGVQKGSRLQNVARVQQQQQHHHHHQQQQQQQQQQEEQQEAQRKEEELGGLRAHSAVSAWPTPFGRSSVVGVGGVPQAEEVGRLRGGEGGVGVEGPAATAAAAAAAAAAVRGEGAVGGGGPSSLVELLGGTGGVGNVPHSLLQVCVCVCVCVCVRVYSPVRVWLCVHVCADACV